MIKNVVLREAKRGRTLLWVDQRSARKKLLNGLFFLFQFFFSGFLFF
jgi:hypothetical protein